MKTCTKCNTSNVDEASFCKACGNSLIVANMYQNQSSDSIPILPPPILPKTDMSYLPSNPTNANSNNSSQNPENKNIHCRNCGKSLNAQAYACTGCGLPPYKGKNHCQNCGSNTHQDAVICINCGVKLLNEAHEKLSSFLIGKNLNKQRLAILIASILGALATFMPWLKAPIIGTINGTKGDGWITMILFAIPIFISLYKDKTKPIKGKLLNPVIFPPILAAIIGIYKIIKFNTTISGADNNNIFSDVVSIGFGLYLVILAGIAVPILAKVINENKLNDE